MIKNYFSFVNEQSKLGIAFKNLPMLDEYVDSVDSDKLESIVNMLPTQKIIFVSTNVNDGSIYILDKLLNDNFITHKIIQCATLEATDIHFLIKESEKVLIFVDFDKLSYGHKKEIMRTIPALQELHKSIIMTGDPNNINSEFVSKLNII